MAKYEPIVREYVDGVDKIHIKIDEMSKILSERAILFLQKLSDSYEKGTPFKYHKIIISNKINLWVPGTHDNQAEACRGDYALEYKGKEPSHKQMCEGIVNDIKNSNSVEVRYNFWVTLLDDVYRNGTINIENYNEYDRELLRLIFWITLQEDINKPYQMGRLRPFCRYLEAAASTIDGFGHTLEEVQNRCDSSCPLTLDRWSIPKQPSFYKWSAFGG